MPRSVQCRYGSQNLPKLNVQCQRSIIDENTKNEPPSFTFSKIPKTWSFHVVVLQRTAKKCTMIYNARAQPLCCVLVAVAIVVCLSSLISLVPLSRRLFGRSKDWGLRWFSSLHASESLFFEFNPYSCDQAPFMYEVAIDYSRASLVQKHVPKNSLIVFCIQIPFNLDLTRTCNAE